MPIRHVERPELGAQGSSVGVFCDVCGKEITESSNQGMGAVVKWDGDEDGAFRFVHKGVGDRRDTDAGRGAWWEMKDFLVFLQNNYRR